MRPMPFMVVLIALAWPARANPPSAGAGVEPNAAGGGYAQGLDPTGAAYAPWPAPDAGYITDLAAILTSEQEIELEQYLWRVEARTGVEIAVLLVDSISDFPGAGRQSIESFAGGVFDRWGVGNMPGNDGVLLLVAVRDRRARIELGAGYGNLRDGDAQRIMDGVIVPKFRDGRYASGVIAGTEALGLRFAGVRRGFDWTMLVAAVMLALSLTISVSLFRSGKRGWGWLLVGGAISVAIYLMEAAAAAHERSGSSGTGSFGDGSPGGFGGGFGGGFSSGGGSSGGGGASGSW